MVLDGGKKIIAISHSVLDMTTKEDWTLSVFFPTFYFPVYLQASPLFLCTCTHTLILRSVPNYVSLFFNSASNMLNI